MQGCGHPELRHPQRGPGVRLPPDPHHLRRHQRQGHTQALLGHGWTPDNCINIVNTIVLVSEGGWQCRAEGPAEPPAAHPEAGRGGELGGAAYSGRQRGSRGRGQRSNNVDTPADTTGELHTGHRGRVQAQALS